VKIIGISTSRELPQQVYLMADSAIIKTDKPFFVPHFAQRFTGQSALVLHIDRLGKHISTRFAHRYCHRISPAIKVMAHDIDQRQQSEVYSSLAHSFDGGLLLGNDIDAGEPSQVNTSQVTMTRNGENMPSLSLSDLGLDYQVLISQLSQYFTLKMGDMIVIELGDDVIDLEIGDTLHASLNGTQQLTIRVK